MGKFNLVRPRSLVLNSGHPLAQNLMFDAQLQERGGTTTRDLARRQVGTFLGATPATWITGQPGAGVLFNATRAYIDFPNSSFVDITGTKLTVEVLIEWSTATTGIIISKAVADGSHTAPYFRYSIHWISATSARFWVDTDTNAGVNTLDSALSLTVGHTYMIHGTYDGSNLRIYQDGVLKNTTACSGSVSSSATPLRLGANGAPGEYWNGKLFSARVWKACLSDQAIRSQVNNPWQIYGHANNDYE